MTRRSTAGIIFTLICISVLPAQIQNVSRGFDTISLGMSMSEVQDALPLSPFVDYRGPADLSMRPNTDDPIIRSEGNGFIDEIFLQFKDDILFSIIITADRLRIDYGTFYRQFSAEYGEPSFFSPNRCEWSDEETVLILEKPVTIQYLDREAFESMVELRDIGDSAEAYARDMFLDRF